MEKYYKKFIWVLLFYVLLTTIVTGVTGLFPVNAVGGWVAAEEGGISTTYNSKYPSLAVFNSTLYAAWQETHGATDEIAIKKYNGTWDLLSGMVSTKLNSSSNNARNPALATFGSVLYAAWVESDSGVWLVHVKKYDGSTWSFIQDYTVSEGRTCINHDSGSPGKDVKLLDFNGNLYATWAEQVSGGKYQIRVSVFNGSLWSSIDGNGPNGLNKDPGQDAQSPSLGVFNGNLYIVWEEIYNSRNQLRVMRYDGDSTWVFVDGNGSTGKNYDSTFDVKKPVIANYGGMMYVFWAEAYYDLDYGNIDLIRFKTYNGSSWGLDSGGWNRDITYGAYNPFCVVYNNLLYVSWNETASGVVKSQIRACKFDGVTKTFIDGGGTTGLNYSTSRHAYAPALTIYSGDLYSVWYENNGTVDQIRAQKLPLPAITTSVDIPANGTYRVGQMLTFTVNYSKNVNVNVTGGTPYIPVTLDTGGTVQASYTGGSGTKVLTFQYTILTGNIDTNGIAVGGSINANGATLGDADNNAVLTLNNMGSTTGVMVDGVAPTLVSAARIDNTRLLVTLSENCTNIINSNNGGFTVCETGPSGILYTVSQTAQGADASHVELTVADMGVSAKEGVTVKYTAGGIGTVQDNPGNPLATNSTGVTVPAWDTTSPTITSGALAAGNGYMDVVFSEGVYGASNGATALTASKLSLIFIHNGGNATNVQISSVKKNDNAAEGSASELTGGETTVRVFLNITGNPSGVETVEIKPWDGSSIFDRAGNAVADSQTTGAKLMNETSAPYMVSAARTNNTQIVVTLSENCINLTKSNDGGFTVCETGAPGTTYPVASIAQGADASHVVLTVADMAISAREGVTVKYTAGGNGTVQDTVGNPMATDGTGVTVAAWDTTSPAISSGTLASNNGYIDINFSEGIYGANDGTTALTAAKLSLAFLSNGGNTTAALISSVKKNNSAVEGSASALTGGETIVRVFLNLTGTPSGVETIEIKPQNGTSVYDKAGNAVSALQTTGVKTLNDQLAPTLVSALRTDDTHLNVTLSENCVNLTKANDGGFTVCETGAPGTTYAVASITQGADAHHVVLTVADPNISAKEGITVKYTSGGNGTVQDTAGNAMATNSTGVTVAPWDTISPTILSGTLASNNVYLDLAFSEGIYGLNDGTTPLTIAKLQFTFLSNTGTATNAVISAVKKNDGVIQGAASALTGGETIVRVFISITGNPSGVETVEIKPATGASIYDKAGNPVSISETTGVKTLNELSVRISTDQALTETILDDCGIKVTLSGITFADATLASGNFTLTSAPAGLTVEGVTYTDSTHCLVNLAFNGTDFSSNITNLGLTVAGAELTGGSPMTSVNNLTIAADSLPQKQTVIRRPGVNGVSLRTAGNIRNDLNTVWNHSSLLLGKGVSGRNADLWLYDPAIFGSGLGQVPATAQIDRAELVLKIKNFTGNTAISRQIKIYTIIDPSNLGNPYFVTTSSEGSRAGLDFLYRDHRLGRNKLWKTGAANILALFSGVQPACTFNYTPQVYTANGYSTIRLEVTSSLKSWINGKKQGWYLTIGGSWAAGEQIEFYGATATNPEDRPYLRVVYATSGDLTPPSAVTGLAAIPGNRQITLNWTNPLADFGGVRVLRKPGAVPANPVDGTIVYEGTAITCADTGLNNGETYYYAVYAFDTSRNYGSKASISAIPGTPEAPGLNNPTKVTGSVNLIWSAAAGATSYNVYRSATGEPASKLAENIGVTNYTDYRVATKTYTYWVTGTNSSGEGPSSTKKSIAATAGTLSPAIPSGLVLTVESSTSVRVSWSDNSNNATGFTVERKTGSGSWSVIATLLFNQTNYLNTGLLPNTTYQYRVKATNATGSSGYTGPLSVTTSNLPVAPSGLTWTIISASQVRLNWTDSPNETGYEVEVWKLGVKERTINLPQNAIKCAVTGLTPNVNYFFRVVAVNVAGRASVETENVKTPKDPKTGIL